MTTTTTTTAWDDAVQAVRRGEDPTGCATGIVELLDDAELLGLLDGDTEFWPGLLSMMGTGYNLEPIVAGELPRLGLPGLRFADGPRGVVVGRSTCFPVPMARGATWDPELEERVGTVIGRETAAQGGNLFAGVCVNLLRHPAWGRAQETYGEDPLHVGLLGSALTRGVQQHVMACVKHFALNSMENARFTVDVEVDDQDLHEVYLPHFRAVVEAGVASVMSAYNSVNGEWCGQSPALLTGVLRDEWGFDGFVISDFVFGLRDAVASVPAGLDVEMPFRQQRAQQLPAALSSGALARADVVRAAVRVLSTSLRFAAALPAPPPATVVAGPEHVALAREVAARSFVLLRNAPVDGAPVLPLRAAGLRRLAVVGRLADLPNTGDHGSSDVRPPYIVTPLQGLREALPGVQVDTAVDLADAVALAQECDAVVVCVGYTAEDEGEYVGDLHPSLLALFPPAEDDSVLLELASARENGAMGTGGDRDLLTLHPQDVELVRAVAAVQPRSVVAVTSAGAVLMADWVQAPAATLLTWYAGMEGGRALADVLLGQAEPTGRLPFAVPASAQDLPGFDKTAEHVVYDGRYGQRLLDQEGRSALFPLGFGLGYTTFRLDDAQVARDADGLAVTVQVSNEGERAGRHVVQVYALRPGEPATRRLVGFRSVEVPAGSSHAVEVPCSLRPLEQRRGGGWQPAAGRWELEVAACSGDPAALHLDIDLDLDLDREPPRGR